MKILCEVTGEFSLFWGSEWLNPDMPDVITPNEFWAARTAIGQVRVLGNLRDDATAAEWKRYWEECKGDRELAVDSFLATFGESTKAPKKKVAKT